MAEAAHHLHVQFADLRKQTHAAVFGMWVFVGSEFLFFAALFALYAGYRAHYGQLFNQAARHTDLFLGSANTFILLTSSYLVAAAVHAVRDEGAARRARLLLAGAIGLGVLFLALKFTEYAHHFSDGIYPGRYYAFDELMERGAAAFFTLYYLMTGVHALHVTVGVGLLTWLAIASGRGRYTPEYHTPLELGGMYWHLVDIIWVFLWPIFYLFR